MKSEWNKSKNTATESNALPDEKAQGIKRNKKSKRKRRWVLPVVLLLVVACAVGVFFILRNQNSNAPEATSQISTTPLSKTDLQETLEASGTIASAKSVEIYAPSSLPVESVSVKLGDVVESGQLLAQLDTSSIEESIANQELNIRSAESKLSSSEQSAAQSSRNNANSLRSAKTDLELAQEAYERQRSRVEAQQSLVSDNAEASNTTLNLAEEGNASDELAALPEEGSGNGDKSELDAVASAVKQAKLELDAAQKSYDDLLVQAGETSSVKQAQLELDAAQLSYDQAASGYSTTNSVTTAQMEVDAAQANLNQVSLQQNNQVATAQLDLQNSENSYYIAVNNYYSGSASNSAVSGLDAEVGGESSNGASNTDQLYDKMISAEIALEKQRISYSNTLLARDTAIQNAQDSLEKAQLSLDNARKNSDTSVENSRQALEKAKLNYNNAVTNASESLQNAADALEKAKLSYHNALDAQVESLESAETSLLKAQSSYETARNSSTVSETESSKINIEQQYLSLDSLQNELADATVRSPESGTITYCSLTQGATANGLIFVVEDTANLIINSTVGEADINSIAVGQKVYIQTESTDEESFEGRISSISDAATKSADGSTAATTNVTFDIVIEVLDADSRLKIGMNAQLSIVIAEATDIFAVPTEAVSSRGPRSFIQVMSEEEDAAPRQISVEVGLENDTMTEISGQELREGMLVLTGSDYAGGASGEGMAARDNRGEGMEGMPNMGGTPPGGSGMPAGGMGGGPGGPSGP